jgi:hypothetical protein
MRRQLVEANCSRKMSRRPHHRGSVDNPAKFAKSFVRARMGSVEKDLRICLTPRPLSNERGMTRAYFPALSLCCGTIEYLTALHRGSIRRIGWQQVSTWAEIFLPQPDYNADVVRILIEAFRHPIAHRGIASGVWVDRSHGPGRGRRITWKVLADARRPAVRIVPEQKELRNDPPWPCRYTHRVHIHLRSMRRDIREASKRYVSRLQDDQALQESFMACMRQLYPH